MGGEVVDGYFCAMREEGYCNGTTDAGEATGYSEDFVGKEGWERHVDEDGCEGWNGNISGWRSCPVSQSSTHASENFAAITQLRTGYSHPRYYKLSVRENLNQSVSDFPFLARMSLLLQVGSEFQYAANSGLLYPIGYRDLTPLLIDWSYVVRPGVCLLLRSPAEISVKFAVNIDS